MTTAAGLVRNSARCLHCGVEISSTTRHEFVSCPCGSVCVDGGLDYIRRVWDGSLGDAHEVFEDTSICRHDFEPFIAHCPSCGAANPEYSPAACEAWLASFSTLGVPRRITPAPWSEDLSAE